MNTTDLKIRANTPGPWRQHIYGLLLLIVGSCLALPAGAQEPVTLNFKNADINALIDAVAELTGKNFVVDPRVKGKITVISKQALGSEEIYKVFLSILDVHGYSAVPAGQVIKILPDVRTKASGIPDLNAGDKIGGDQMVTEVIAVRNVAAAQLVPILRPLVPQQGHLAAYPTTNILVVSDRVQNVQRLKRIIARIDQASDSEIDIVPLQHASASEVVRIINDLQAKAAKGQAVQGRIQLAADERTNSVLLSGEEAARLRYRAMVTHLDTPLQSSGNTKVIYLRYQKAKDLLDTLTNISKAAEAEKGKGKKAAKPSTPTSIQADETTNALIITAPPDQMRSLQEVIRQLDIRRAQVLVEAIIAEVTLDKSRELGVQWVVDGRPGGQGAVGVINFSGGAASIASIGAAVAAEQVPAVGDGITIGAGKFNTNKIDFAGLLQALSSDSDSNILSTPSLTTLDNQEAEIVVGENVPFITGEFSSTGGGSSNPTNPFRTIERRDVGITLRVTPQINEGSAVQLDIEQEVSNVIGSATGASDLTTSKRSIKTSVVVEDGNTIVLGGLIDDNLTQTSQKVPLLGDIPLVGKLFRSERTTKRKRNLMIFLRPVIVRDAATESKITHSKYNYIRAQQAAVRERGVALMNREDSPLLPEKIILPQPFDAAPASAQPEGEAGSADEEL